MIQVVIALFFCIDRLYTRRKRLLPYMPKMQLFLKLYGVFHLVVESGYELLNLPSPQGTGDKNSSFGVKELVVKDGMNVET